MVFDEPSADSPAWVARTAPEIGSIGQKDGSVAVIPVGSIEQHGNHLPVSTDTVLADTMAHSGAEEIAGEVPILVTPPIWSGLSPHHMEFGGTITLEVETMVSVLHDVAASVLDNGFDAILFLNGHGGNTSIVDTATTEIGQDYPDEQILSLTYFQLAEPFIDDIRESDIGGMAHGGEFETSLMYHVRPDLVRETNQDATYMDDEYELRRQDLFKGGPLGVYRSFSEYTESGAIGDPELAAPKKGAELLKRIIDELADLLMGIHIQNSEE